MIEDKSRVDYYKAGKVIPCKYEAKAELRS